MATQIQIDDVKEKFAELQILKNQLSDLMKKRDAEIVLEDKKRNAAVNLIMKNYAVSIPSKQSEINALLEAIGLIK